MSRLPALRWAIAAPTVNPASVIATANTALASAWNTEARALAATAQSLASQHGG